jgi:transposase
MFFFGIDWSQKDHNLCIRSESGKLLSQVRFPHSVEGFQRLVAEREKLDAPPSDCPVAIETAHNLLVDFLLDYGHPIYIVPPQATHGYRSRHRSSGARTDESDAALLADILRTDRHAHIQLQPNLPITQAILVQVRLVETLRQAIQRHTNQLRDALIRSYPVALGVFGDLTSQITLHFLMAYPTEKHAQSLSREAFDLFCRQHHYTRTDLLSHCFANLMEPMPKPNPATAQAYENHVRLAQILLPLVRFRKQAIAELQNLFHQHPDAQIFLSLPGTGDILAPALLAKFGDHRQRFPTPNHVQALAGTCPVTRSSGKRSSVKYRQACDKEFRRIAQQFARSSVPQSGWAAAYWHQVCLRGKSDSHGYRILANRWLAIIWKLWQTRQLYDESYHLKQRALRRRPKPLAA